MTFCTVKRTDTSARASEDSAEIVRLHAAFEAQKAAFVSAPKSDLEERRRCLLANTKDRQSSLKRVIDSPDDLALMWEIVAPILPVKAYGDVRDAVNCINEGDRPLGPNEFAQERSVADHILAGTTSGGAR